MYRHIFIGLSGCKSHFVFDEIGLNDGGASEIIKVQVIFVSWINGRTVFC